MNSKSANSPTALQAARRDTGVLIAAHRGTSGGNIVQNTIQAYENALFHGADMVEIDVSMSTDGVLYCFHDGQEPLVLGADHNIRTMSSDEVDSYQLLNSLNHPIHQRVNRLDDVLEALKGRCLINIDRSWFAWEQTIRCLVRHNMADQLILKSHVEAPVLQALADSGSGLMYMPIIYKPEQLKQIRAYDLNTAAMELIFLTDDSPLASPEMIDTLHGEGLLLWANAITLDDRVKLVGDHDDDHSVLHGPDDGWGWLMRRGFDILQTDWPAPLKAYLTAQGART